MASQWAKWLACLPPYFITRFVFLTETESVLCEIRTECFNTIQIIFVLQGFNNSSLWNNNLFPNTDQDFLMGSCKKLPTLELFKTRGTIYTSWMCIRFFKLMQYNQQLYCISLNIPNARIWNILSVLASQQGLYPTALKRSQRAYFVLSCPYVSYSQFSI